MRKVLCAVLSVSLLFILAGCSMIGVPKKDYEAVVAENERLTKENEQLKEQNDKILEEYADREIDKALANSRLDQLKAKMKELSDNCPEFYYYDKCGIVISRYYSKDISSSQVDTLKKYSPDGYATIVNSSLDFAKEIVKFVDVPVIFLAGTSDGIIFNASLNGEEINFS